MASLASMPINTMLLLLSLIWLLPLSMTSVSAASDLFLNAYNAPLSALTSPHSYYLLEFPLDKRSSSSSPSNANAKANGHSTSSSSSSSNTKQTPQCGNGSPYSFLFRRGTNSHVHKLFVEFEGATYTQRSYSTSPQPTSSRSNYDSVPWSSLDLIISSVLLLSSGTYRFGCKGILNQGFVKKIQDRLLGNGSNGGNLFGFDTSTSTSSAGNVNEKVEDVDVDVPIFLRPASSSSTTSLMHDDLNNTDTAATNSTIKSASSAPANAWYEQLSGDYSNIDDWSYIYIPHCTPSDESQTRANVNGVLDWITTQFKQGEEDIDSNHSKESSSSSSSEERSTATLDAIIALSGGGRIGGCYNTFDAARTNVDMTLSFVESVATRGLLSKQQQQQPQPDGTTMARALAIVDGSTLWSDLRHDTSSTSATTSASLSTNDDTTTTRVVSEVATSMVKKVLSSSDTIELAWIASKYAIQDEVDFLDGMEMGSSALMFGNRFHYHQASSSMPSSSSGTTAAAAAGEGMMVPTCQQNSFSDKSANENIGFHTFLREVVEGMSWSQENKENNNNNVVGSWKNENNSIDAADSSSGGEHRLSFLSIFAILLGLYIISWVVYYILVRRQREQQQQLQQADKENEEGQIEETNPLEDEEVEEKRVEENDSPEDEVKEKEQEEQLEEQESPSVQNVEESHVQNEEEEGKGQEQEQEEDFEDNVPSHQQSNYISSLSQQQTRTTSTTKSTMTILSPHDLWFKALTTYPVIFLFVSVLIPTTLSIVAFANEGYTLNVNLDFESYLDIDTKEERVSMQYKTLVEYQKESLEMQDEQCDLLASGYDTFSFDDRKRERRRRKLYNDEYDDVYGDLFALEEEEDEMHGQMTNEHDSNRDLQAYFAIYNQRMGRSVINLFYQARNGGTVFTPEVLQSIRQFEQSLLDIPDFTQFCYGPEVGVCHPLSSIIPYFFPDGENLVDDIDSVLRALPGSKTALAKLDKYFSEDNLGSNVTVSHIMLNDIDGRNRQNTRQFLETLHQELWKIDHERRYPNLIISWRNTYTMEVEASDALQHDFIWSFVALCFIGIMIYVKVRNAWLVFAGVMGLLLSFTSALYWVQSHFQFNELNGLHVAGIFVMLGIGADDIFLLIDSFEHTEVDFIKCVEGDEAGVDLNDPTIMKQRLISAYKTAGSMMLVSSVTTAICFFSNVMSAVVSIRDFGSYMGMVVVLNYLHVMTILPSAVLVNEKYIKPRRKQKNIQLVQNDATDTETGVPVQDNRRDSTIAITNTTSLDAVDSEDANDPLLNDYVFLDHTKEMTLLDRYFVERHAPNVYKWRRATIASTIFVAILLGILGYFNFELYDGTIIVFQEKYNMGRVQKVVDKYFPQELVSKYDEESGSVGGEGLLPDIPAYIEAPSVSLSGSSLYTPPTLSPNSMPPTRQKVGSPNILVPSADSSLSPATSQNNLNGSTPTTSVTVTASFGAGPPVSPVSSVNPVVDVPGQTPTSSGTVNTANNGNAPEQIPTNIGTANTASNGNIPGQTPANTGIGNIPMSSPSPGAPASLLDSGVGMVTPTSSSLTDATMMVPTINETVEACKCDGWQSFTCNTNALEKNEALYICIRSASVSEVEAFILDSMVINQGQSSLKVVNGNEVQYASFTSVVYNPSQYGYTVSTRVPIGMFKFGDDEPITISGVVNIKLAGGTTRRILQTSHLIGSMFDESASYEVIVKLVGQSTMQPTTPPPTVSAWPTDGPSLSKQPTASPMSMPSSQPSKPKTVCAPGLPCLTKDGGNESFRRRQYYSSSIVWGMKPLAPDPTVWIIQEDNTDKLHDEALSKSINANYIDPAEPRMQEWLIEIATYARNNPNLRLHPQLTWMEYLKRFALENGYGFPIEQDVFLGIIELLKMQSSAFSKLVEGDLGTKSTGLNGQFLYTSQTFLSEVPLEILDYSSETSLAEWSNFSSSMNEMLLSEGLPPITVQSKRFLDSQRNTAIVDSTVSSYFFANGLYLVVMLIFMQNLSLTLFVMVSLLLILSCFCGLVLFVYQIKFGPVESLGVSIFVGLSANYLLHVAHTWHQSKIHERNVKMQRTLFVVGSPILWSAISTVGGSLFLFACRTWLLTELGILICTIIALSLMCSLGFLLALLGSIGPLPVARQSHLHSCDLLVIFGKCVWPKHTEDRAPTRVEEDEAKAEAISESVGETAADETRT